MAKILIIDDSPLAIAALQRTLERDGHKTSALEDATGFYARLREFDPDLVFLDLEMPKIAGKEIGEFLGRFDKKSTPIIIFSSRPREELEAVARDISAAAFLQKSDSAVTISSTVRRILSPSTPPRSASSRR
jgi:DNA-binding response OmpR family regulator